MTSDLIPEGFVEIPPPEFHVLRLKLAVVDGDLRGVKPGTKQHDLPGESHDGHWVTYCMSGDRSKRVVARIESRHGLATFMKRIES